MTLGQVELKWIGTNRLGEKLAKEASKRQKAVARAAKVAGLMVQAHARKSILRDPKTGRVYGKHQASADGESPANDTGNLARNIVVLADEQNGVAYVISRAPYSAALEYGARRKLANGKIAFLKARPFMAPALEANLPLIKDLFKKALRGENS